MTDYGSFRIIPGETVDTWGPRRSWFMRLVDVLFRRRQHTLHLVFDRMPDHDGARFIEAEDARGNSVRAGQWFVRSDGLAELVIKL